MSKPTIADMLNSIKASTKTKTDSKPELANTAETWMRIGEKDSFSELGLEGSELDDFLAEWRENNPYSNI